MKNKHEIEIEIKGKEWQDAIDASFKKKVKDVKVDGFRKGAVPKNIYIKKFGVESLYMDAVDSAAQVAYKKMMAESKLNPIIEPRLDIKHICDDCVTFLFTIVTKPEIKLGAYTKLKVKKESPKVTKEEVDKEIETLRNKFAEIIEKTEGELKSGNTAVIDFEGKVDGKVLDGGTGTNYPLEIGSNTFIPGFEEKLIGMKVGEEKSIDLKFPEDYVEDLKGKDVTFKVKLNSIKERVLPDMNKEFFEDLGMKDVTDEKSLNEEVKNSLSKKKEVDIENEYVENCLSKVAENMKVEINPEIVEEETHRMIHQFEDQLKMQGLTLDQYFEFTKGNADDLKKNMEPEATKRIKYRFLIEEVATKEKIEVSDEDASKEAEEMAKKYNMETNEFLKEFGGIEMVKYDVRMHKAIDIIKAEK